MEERSSSAATVIFVHNPLQVFMSAILQSSVFVIILLSDQ